MNSQSSTNQWWEGSIQLYQMGARWYDYYRALRWRHDTLDVSRMKIGLYEALKIADRYGGQEFRESVRDRCVVSIFVSDYEWVIGYKELGQLTWSDLRIQVDAKSGKAKPLPR